MTKAWYSSKGPVFLKSLREIPVSSRGLAEAREEALVTLGRGRKGLKSQRDVIGS